MSRFLDLTADDGCLVEEPVELVAVNLHDEDARGGEIPLCFLLGLGDGRIEPFGVLVDVVLRPAEKGLVAPLSIDRINRGA